MEQNHVPTQSDKLMSALAHASVIMPLWGIVVPALIWVTQREKSSYMRYQSFQALGWQIGQVALLFVGMLLYGFSLFGLLFSAQTPTQATPPTLFVAFGVFGLLFLAMVMLITVGLYAAVRNLQGRPFTYPLIGKRAQAYMR
jgi:uncharacterized Tic20 family protein